uniref:Uncharacterized protein n=1 Tax=Johnson-sea-linkia profunda TaxID=575876 RepID=A0A386AXK4_9CHLO|nr:hypothetical protein [Johnson-sea-linkia profunda]
MNHLFRSRLKALFVVRVSPRALLLAPFFQSLFFICYSYFCLPARGLESRAPLIATVQTQQAIDLDKEMDKAHNCRNRRDGGRSKADEGLVLPFHGSNDFLGVFELVREPSGSPSVVFVPAAKGHKPNPVATLAVQPSKKRSSKKTLTIIGGGAYITWRIWQHFCPWPQMPDTFYQSVENTVNHSGHSYGRAQTVIYQGNSSHGAHFVNGLISFINLPPERRIVKSKIQKILDNRETIMDTLYFFYTDPLRFVELFEGIYCFPENHPHIHMTSSAEENRQLLGTFYDKLKELDRACGETRIMRIHNYRYSFSLPDITYNFEGDPGLFDFLIGRVTLNFWNLIYSLQIS